MAVLDLVYSLPSRGYAAVQWLLGAGRTAQLDRWFAAAYRDRPLLFGLVVTWLAFCAVPLAVFLGYVALWTVAAFGVFWAIVLFWAGLGLVFLVPALCVATGLSVVVFVWAAVTYVVGVRVLALAGYSVGGGGNGGSRAAVVVPATTKTTTTGGVYSNGNGVSQTQ